MNQKGFTLIELIVIIVILGILAVTAIPKYVDMKTDAEIAAADGVLGGAQGATTLNFAANLLGKFTPASYVTNATALVGAMEDLPTNWALLDADCSGFNAAFTLPGTSVGCICLDNNTVAGCEATDTYIINIEAAETATAKAVLSKSW